MMIFVLFNLMRIVVSTAIQPDHEPEYTIASYGGKSLIFSLFEQNPFLSLPEATSQTIRGSEQISIAVPPPFETYLWELSGFFKAPASDNYTFSIGDTELGILQVGSSEGHYQNFQDLFEEDKYVLSNSPATLFLKKDAYYPLKISYISGLESVPIYLVSKGEMALLNTEILHIVKEDENLNSGEPVYFGSGFDFLVFLGSNTSDPTSLIENRSDLYLIHEGSFDAEFQGISNVEVEVTNLKEITGYFKVPNDGDYNVLLFKGPISCFQFGPGTLKKTETYIIDSTWNILDTRATSSDEFSFSAGLYYPFRLVISGLEDDILWQSRIQVTDSSENEINIFGSSTIESQSVLPLPIATSHRITVEPEKVIENIITGFKEVNNQPVVSPSKFSFDQYSNGSINTSSIMDRNTSLSEEISSSLSSVEGYSGPSEHFVESISTIASSTLEIERSTPKLIGQTSPNSSPSTIVQTNPSPILNSKENRDTIIHRDRSTILGKELRKSDYSEEYKRGKFTEDGAVFETIKGKEVSSVKAAHQQLEPSSINKKHAPYYPSVFGTSSPWNIDDMGFRKHGSSARNNVVQGNVTSSNSGYSTGLIKMWGLLSSVFLIYVSIFLV